MTKHVQVERSGLSEEGCEVDELKDAEQSDFDASQDDGLGRLRERFAHNPAAVAVYDDNLRREELIRALKADRTVSGIKQRQIAEAMGTTQSAVSEFENGRVEPQLQTLQRYARAAERRLDVAVVHPGLPVYTESTAPRLWQALEKRVLSPIFTALATDKLANRTVDRLAEDLDLDASIVRYLLKSLEERGWIASENRDGQSVFSIGPRAACAIGISLEGEVIVGVLTDLSIRVLHRREVEIVGSRARGVVEDAIVRLVRELHSLSSDQHVVGVGISVAGAVTADTGVVKFAPDLWGPDDDWQNVTLEGDLQSRLQRELHDDTLRVLVENDANALAVHQYLKHASARQDESSHDSCVAVVLMTSAGIGAGSVAHGHVMYGANSVAGEGGHTIIELKSEQPCRANTGHSGCLETIASVRAMIERVGLPSRTPSEVAKSFSVLSGRLREDANGPESVVLREAGAALGYFISMLITANDPGQVHIFAFPELSEGMFESARLFQRSVEEGIHMSSMLTEQIKRKTDLEWKPIQVDTRAAAAAAAVTRKFLYKPYHWVPAVLDPALAG